MEMHHLVKCRKLHLLSGAVLPVETQTHLRSIFEVADQDGDGRLT